jgi:hypothetical protein
VFVRLVSSRAEKKKCGVSGRKHDEGTLLWKLGPTWEDKAISKWIEWECEDWIYVTKDGQIAGNCEHINKVSESAKCYDFID